MSTTPTPSQPPSQQNQPPQPSQQQQHHRRPHILLGITGSVAAVKGPEIALHLSLPPISADVRIILTKSGRHFWDRSKEYNERHWTDMMDRTVVTTPPPADANGGRITIYDPHDEWSQWQRLGDDVIHISLRDWADICLVAPLSAHTLAKISQGFCDDLLTSCLRAWDFSSKRKLVLAPAMNTGMWNHPLTKQQLDTIVGFGEEGVVTVVPPVRKLLACGEWGVGALADVGDIVSVVRVCCVEKGFLES